jgi:tetratricopeptide (TPR) repeat protein
MKNFFNITFAILLYAFASSLFAQDESRASKTWEVQKYDIAATLPQADTDRYLTVKAALDLKNASGAAGSRLTLRISDKAEVSAVRVNNAVAEFTKGEEKIGSRNLQRIIVRVPPVQPNQTFSVAVDYKLKTDENTGLNALSLVGSQFLPLSFWYPTPNSWYFARGADFAPVRLQVASVNGETIVSSGTQTGNSFEQRLNGQPFFVAGNWDKIEANGVSVFAPKGAEVKSRVNELAALASEAKTFTANFLSAAPDVSIRIVAVRRGAGFSEGGTIFVDESVFRRQKIDAQTALTVGEAVAKIWIGNAASVSGDGFGVIREGLPQFIATQFLESKYGKEIANVERLRQRTAYAAIVRRDAPLNFVSPLDDYFYTAVSNKGAMIWRLLAKRVGQNEFFEILRAQMKDGNLNLNEIRQAFPAQKDFLDVAFDQITETNLLVGLPQTSGAETKIALRNLGAIDAVAVNVLATTQTGEKLTAQSTIQAKSFGEINFKTPQKIVRVEVDADKFYPQIDYSDDVAPREFETSDALSVIKRAFDKGEFAAAEKSARTALQSAPRFDDARIWLARSLAAQNKNAEAEKEFRLVLDEKLPTARSLAWANVGLGEIALRSSQNSQAATFFSEAIKANAEYGATLAARAGLNKIGAASGIDESVKAFFAQFDKAAISGRKADVDALILAGEMMKFSSGISGQAQEWVTRVSRVDKLNASNALAEVVLNIRLLNKNAESGTAVFLLSRVDGNWKLSGVEIFEVR